MDAYIMSMSPHTTSSKTDAELHLYRVIKNDCRDDEMLLAWPPRSPDATPCDFFLWGYVKDQVYVPPLPASIPETEGTNQNRH